MNFPDLSDCVFATWSPRIGDPSVMGWLTVAAYVAASALTALVAARPGTRPRLFWLVLSLLLLGLAVNKQLDLQTALTATGRCLAKAQGWYDRRGVVQMEFIAAVMAGGLILTLLTIRMMRRYLADTWLAITGFGMLMTFIAVRAAGFHHVDRLIGHEIGGVRLNWILELGGITLIAANAAYLLIRRAKGP
jgi:hypothetical protein